MKKAVPLSLILILCLAISTGCGNKKEETTSTPPTTESTTQLTTESTADTATQTQETTETNETEELEDVVIDISGDAMLIASSARYSGTNPTYKDTFVTDWTANTSVHWVINVLQPGRYEIALNYSADSDDGGKGVLDVNGTSAEFNIASTGGADNTEKLVVMEANLSAGEGQLTITADSGVASNFMNLKRVVLVKLSDTLEVSGKAPLTLTPDNALYGPSGPSNEGGNNIGGWQADGLVTWQLEVLESGKYEAKVLYTTDTGLGGVATFEVAGKTLDFAVDETGGWDKYVELNAGTITLTEGKKDLLFYASEMNGDWFINVKSVVLTRVGDASVKVDNSGEIELLPDDAVLSGGAVNQHTDIGGWVHGVEVVWPVEVVTEGNYEVVLYGAAPDGMGGKARFSFTNMIKDFEVVPTGDWSNYAEQTVGVIGLRAGNYDLHLAATEYNDNWFMNCQKVVLKHVGDFAPVTTVGSAETNVPASACVTDGPTVENNWGNIGGWQRGGKVSWTLDVLEAGDYELILNHAGDGGTGGHGIITIGGTSHDIQIEPTGGWGEYTENSMGVFSIGAGQTVITIEAADDAADWFMNVSAFKLIKK